MASSTRQAPSETQKRLSVSRLAVPVLGILGIAITSYLTYTHYSGAKAICIAGASCDAVLTSHYSEVWGIPLSLFGLAMYIVITAMGFWFALRESASEHLLALGIYGIAVTGILFTAYLYYLEIFVLHAFCTWCIASSIVLALIFVFSIINFATTKHKLDSLRHTRRFKLSDYVQW